jgi:hypothetical protein
MSSEKELKEYIRFLRNAAPQEFGNFCMAFDNYTKTTIEYVVHATGDLQLVQGRAQQCVKLRNMFQETNNG